MGRNADAANPIGALAAEYNFMRDNTVEKEIARTLLSMISEIPQMTLETAAQRCNVSVSTFLRFCKSIGYSSYSTFKIRIADDVENYHYKHSPFAKGLMCDSHSYMDTLTQTIEGSLEHLKSRLDIKQYEKLADLIYIKKKIFIHDAMYSTVRLQLQSDLAITGKIVTFSPNLAQQTADIPQADADSIFLINYDENYRSKEAATIIPALKKKNAAMAIVTSTPNVPGKELCDVIIEIGSGKSTIAEMMIRDIFYQYLSVIYQEKYI